MVRFDSSSIGFPRHAQVESRVINADHGIRLKCFNLGPAFFESPANRPSIFYNLPQAHECEGLVMPEARSAGSFHGLATPALNFDRRLSVAQGADEQPSVRVPGCLTCDDENSLNRCGRIAGLNHR